MANLQQLERLKKGVDGWNRWRDKNLNVSVDLPGADLRGAHLDGANLSETDLRRANFGEADPSEADLINAKSMKAELEASSGEVDLSTANMSFLVGHDDNFIQTSFNITFIEFFTRTRLNGADIRKAFLNGANLSKALLSGANLSNANLLGANLSQADLSQTNLSEANLGGANLSQASLVGADLREAQLVRSNFSKALIGKTVFGNSDLSKSIGLDSVIHSSPSVLSRDVFIRSRGRISEVFLRGCGLSDWEIEMVKLYNPDLSNDERNKVLYKIYDLQVSQAIQISPLFISYSHEDKGFVDKVGDNLTEKGIRYWRDIHEMKAGRMERQIDRAIRQNPTVLLVLSEHSLKSDWVEHEVRAARALEKDMGRDVLCPIALDDSWKNSKWEQRIMEQIMKYNILDFSAWMDDVKFEGMFRKLIAGLELFYKG